MSHKKDNIEKRIFLGYPFDLLLDRKCKYSDYDNPDFLVKDTANVRTNGGLLIPNKDTNGSGNIIIKGRPGTGKSTLAMQIAAWATLKCNNCLAAYISLEESPSAIIRKAKDFKCNDTSDDKSEVKSDNKFIEMKHLHSLSENPSAKELGQILERILTQPETCPIKQGKHSAEDSLPNGQNPHKHWSPEEIQPNVLLPSFSPRILSPDEDNENRLFWERYQQLRNLLAGAKWLRKKNENEVKKNKIEKEVKGNKSSIPELRLFCIDNLNIFGSKPLNREALFRIFDLCKQYEVIGIFIMETEDYTISENYKSVHQDITEYMADTVISLQMTEDKGYFLRYLEIEKSRYQHQIYGKHPFKLKTLTNLSQKKEESEYKDEHILRELVAIQNIFIDQYKRNNDKNNKKKLFRSDAAVYLCWFSQIRQLISRNPELAGELEVCALPGGGIRGDWFLGIVKSSVSVNLGLKVIKKLCAPNEDYLRFARGIGLPTRINFYTEENAQVNSYTLPASPKYFAWPRAIVELNNVFKIHRHAIRRSSIPYYEEFRQQLGIVFSQLIPPRQITTDSLKRIKKIVERLPQHFLQLAPKMKNIFKESMQNSSK